jgi:glycosyltransferase involved in cell wall biosynthesis
MKRKKLRIAQISPFEEQVPPPKYGGTELIVSYLTEGLIKRGHKVYLVASGDSITKAKLFPVFPTAIRKSLPEREKGVQAREALKFIGLGKILEYLLYDLKVDIIHNHVGWRLLAFESIFKKTPMVTTIHGPLDIPLKQIVYGSFPNSYLVSISNNQRKPMPQLNYVATVYNGIDVKNFEFSNKEGKYLAFLARISPEKGPVQAIQIAKKSGLELKMAAKVDVVDKDFFEKKVNPLIDNKQIKFLGEVDHKTKVELLKNAKALLCPIQWEEPFGLFIIEAMACGTPVIAFARGSVPEIIKDGETGFIINSSPKDIRGNWIIKKTGINGMVEAVKKIYNMPEKEYQKMRYLCRKHVEKNFTAEKMVSEYEKVYYKILKK